MCIIAGFQQGFRLFLYTLSAPDMGLSAASNLFQSVLGTVLLIGGNVLAGKINPDSRLF